MNRRNFLLGSTAAVAGFSVMSSPTSSGTPALVEPGKRVGIIGLDTSHSEVFSRLINSGTTEIKGYRVVAAYAPGSKDIPSALKLAKDVVPQVKSMGIAIVDTIDALLSQVDVVLLESNDGRPHLEQVMPVLKAGKPVFIDKPIAADLKGTKAIFEAAGKYKVPVFSSSALRFDGNVQKVVNGSIGAVTGADVYTPADMEPHHSDLAWYAIHGVEMLFTVMGPGCESVSRTYQDGTDLVVGVWQDGRIGTVRGIRKGAANIAGTAFGEKGIAPLGPFSSYEPLVKQIIHFFETKNPPVTAQQTTDIFRFIHAADESRKRGGKQVILQA